MPSRRFVLASLLALTAFPAATLSAASRASAAGAFRILASCYPAWLAAREITAGIPGVETDILLQATAGCPHNYTLTPRDMMKLSQAKALMVIGKGYEPFLKDIRRELPAVSILDGGAGIPHLSLDADSDDDDHDHDHNHEHEHDHEHDHDHDHEHDHDHDDDHDHKKENSGGHESSHHHSHEDGNPHYFSSPARAAVMVETYTKALAALLPDHAEALTKNGTQEASLLAAAGNRVHNLQKPCGSLRFILQHDALSWFFHDDGLTVSHVLQAEADEQPSAADLAALVRTVSQDSSRYVLVTEPQFPSRTVDMLARETGCRIISLDPVASGPDQFTPGYYRTVMEQNLKKLEKLA